MYFNPYSIPVFAAAVIMVSVALLISKQSRTPGVKWFILLMLSGTAYSLFYGLELCSADTETARLFYRLEYLGIPFVPAAFLLFAISYTRKADVRSAWLLISILIIPFATLLLAFTHQHHDLFIAGGEVDDTGIFPVFLFNPGIWYWVHQIYAVTAILVSLILIFRMWLTSVKVFRKQSGIVLSGAAVPFAVYIGYLLGVMPRGIDPMPFSFALTGLIIFAGISRYRLFSLTPLARNMLFDNIPDGVVVLDNNNRLVDFNRAASVLLGIDYDYVGKTAGLLFSGWPDISVHLTNGINSGGFEVSRITSDRVIFLKCNLILLDDDRGVKLGKMLVMHDFTDLKKAELERQESDEKFGLIFENAPLGLMYFDSDGVIEVCNEYFVKLFGSSPEKLTGLNMVKLPDKRVVAAVEKTLKGEKTVFEGRYTSVTGGKTVYIRALFQPVRPAGPVVEGGMCIVEDITGRKLAEDRIKKTNKELHKLNAEKDRFFSILAHDLRSPFSSFLGYTDIMHESLDSMSTDMLHTIVSSMKESASNLYSLLENLLQWSRIQQGVTDFSPEELNVRERVLDCIEPLLSFANDKAIDVVYDLPEPLTVCADRKMLDTILRNIFINAVKFTPHEGSVRISAITDEDEYVVISFSDTGIGMNSEIMDNLFSLDKKTSRTGTDGEPSTGLGLILCNEFVKCHGGSIRVESREGEGSSFYIRLKKSLPECDG